jgi:hypothetical protein
VPLPDPPDYRPPWPLANGHVHTAWAGLVRRPPAVRCERERLETPDGDFIDIDRVRTGSRRVAVLSHGLEGSTGRASMRGMARALSGAGWDILAWNMRGCSGEPNRLLRSYHSGETGDLGFVLSTALGEYESAALVGFSLGGNVTLKFAGERGADPRIAGVVAFSVPCDLAASSVHLERPAALPYMLRFMRSMRAKVRQKAAMFPGALDLDGLDRMRTFREFDDRYTAPIHGFRDAEDYWARSSCRPFLGAIRVPTLIVNALDDPFLPEACYPVDEARDSAFVHLETPRFGGHVAFVSRGWYWSEWRVVKFLGEAP